MVPTQTYIVTGGNSGLGFECASPFAKDSSTLVIIACRNALQGEQAAQRVRAAGGNVDVLPLDLAKQASARSFVETFRKRRFPPLVGVVCNAGMQNVGAPTKTEEGYERTFAVNHLGHYLLTRLLLSDLARGARIIFVSSGTHDPEQKTGMPAPRYTTAEAVAHNFEPGGNAGRRRYTTSKLCNVYCTYEYARRFAGSPDPRLQSLRVNAFDPGLMPATGLARTYSAPLRFVARYILPLLSLFISNIHSPATSGRRLARLASGGEGSATGTYFSDGREIPSSKESYDTQKALDLWNTSAKMTGLPAELSVESHQPQPNGGGTTPGGGSSDEPPGERSLKRAIVTDATSGIGGAVARRLAAQNMDRYPDRTHSELDRPIKPPRALSRSYPSIERYQRNRCDAVAFVASTFAPRRRSDSTAFS